MKRILLPLALLGNALLATTFLLGSLIEDAAARALSHQVDLHLWTALGGMLFATAVHGLVTTYLIGTGRWIEETVRVYELDAGLLAASSRLKYRTIAIIVGSFVLLVVAGALGAAADPASPVGFAGLPGLPPATLHLLVAVAAVGINAWVNLIEYSAVHDNAGLIEEIMSQVTRIRRERGLED